MSIKELIEWAQTIAILVLLYREFGVFGPVGYLAVFFFVGVADGFSGNRIIRRGKIETDEGHCFDVKVNVSVEKIETEKERG